MVKPRIKSHLADCVTLSNLINLSGHYGSHEYVEDNNIWTLK